MEISRPPTQHQENPERLQKKEKSYSRERYKNVSEDEKEKLVECSRKYYRMRKKRLIPKSNDLESFFEAINLFLKAYLYKIVESIYKNR